MQDLLLISFLAALAVAAVVAAIVLAARKRALRRQAAQRARPARATARVPRAATAPSPAAAMPAVARPPASTPARPAAAPAAPAAPAVTRPAAPRPPRPAPPPDFEATRPFEPALESMPPTPRAPIAAPSPAAARRVLVVDDSAVVRAKLGKLLAAQGWTVASARHGLQALERLEREGADLLITDLEMPEMDGRALIAALAGRPLPILAITGHETPPSPASLGGSVLGVLRKPWNEGELQAAVAAVWQPSARLLVH